MVDPVVLKGLIEAAPKDGLSISTRGMATELKVIDILSDNISSFGIPGYQRKTPIVSSFAEFLGPNGVTPQTSTERGRFRRSGNALDFSIGGPGYFARLNPNGQVELTRDGRFKLDKDGYLLTLENKRVLSPLKQPIRFPAVPRDPEDQIKVNELGDVMLYDRTLGHSRQVGRIGVFTADGALSPTADIKQHYVEDSNVMLQDEFAAVMPLRRGFEANRQLFILQSDGLSRSIQELGRAQ